MHASFNFIFFSEEMIRTLIWKLCFNSKKFTRGERKVSEKKKIDFYNVHYLDSELNSLLRQQTVSFFSFAILYIRYLIWGKIGSSEGAKRNTLFY
jgi:hypothetical protein